MKQKTLLKNPQLKIQSGNSGVWLQFKSSNGLYASLNLNLIKDDATIVGLCLKQWATDYALLNPPNRTGSAARARRL